MIKRRKKADKGKRIGTHEERREEKTESSKDIQDGQERTG